MSSRALCVSIPLCQVSSFLPAVAKPLCLCLELAFLFQRFLSLHNPWSIYNSLHCVRCAFLVVSRPQASIWIASCAVPQGLGLFLLPRCSCSHSPDDVIAWTALSICNICLLEVAKGSFRRIDHCSLHWLCCWARCSMLHDMDNMEASCVLYVKVGTFNHLEQSRIYLLTVNK